MNRIILSSTLLAFPFFMTKGQNNGEKIPPTNVVFILADDLGIGDLGCYGQKWIKTPAIDALAAEGMMFTQHYAGSTVSAPSRCVLLTGKHTGHSVIRGNKGGITIGGRPYDTSLSSQEVTVGEVFKMRHYATACVGKWGLGGPSSEGHPNCQGFDYFFGYLGQKNAHDYYPELLFENETPVVLNRQVYSHDLIANKALDFIDKHSDEPFFLYFAPTIPHADIVVPNNELFEYEGKFVEEPYEEGRYHAQAKPKATFAAMVTRLDRDVQRIVDLLKEKGILDHTLIIFTSDNGAHMEGGHHPSHFNSSGPYRGMKRDLYEGGIHTPFIVKWQGVIPEGSVTDHVSAFWDFMPTVCDLVDAGCPNGIDGISYLPTLLGKGKQKRHDYLYYEFHERGGKQAVIQDGWKLIHLMVNNADKAYYELYNLKEDPGEKCNVIKQYPKVVKKMKEMMQQARTPSEIWKFTFEK